jgi:small subunit ribosomal protein S6
MRINEDVLRYLTVRVEALTESGQSVMMQARARGEERDRGRRGGYGDRYGDNRYGDREPRESEVPAPVPAAAGGEA